MRNEEAAEGFFAWAIDGVFFPLAAGGLFEHLGGIP
jgi:hypothetical protein